MINYLRGVLGQKTLETVVIDVNGIGYEVFVPVSVIEKLPPYGIEFKLFIFESVAMYGGSTSYYGFLSQDERDIFTLIKDEVPGTGAKKALDYFDKIAKSLPDFKRCIVNKDTSSLTDIFGFTKKTAEKLIAALKDKLDKVNISGREKWVQSSETISSIEAVSGLVALGYKENQAKEAVKKVVDSGDQGHSVAELIRKSLQYL